MTASDARAQVRVWDVPTRVFHWSMVALFFCSWLTARYELVTWHLRSGAALLVLLLFRLIWGFVGSSTARFSAFIASPPAVLRYLRSLRAGQSPQHHAGHNPAGGWMVMAMLALLLAQIATGLCANDDVQASGPLADLVGKDLSDQLTLWHGRVFQLLALCAWLHVLAAGFYLLVRGENLVKPMVTGSKRAEDVPAVSLRFAPLWLALVLVLLTATFAFWLFRGE